SDGAGQAVALPRLGIALGVTAGVVFGVQRQARGIQRVQAAVGVVHRHAAAEERGQADVGVAVLLDLRVGVLAGLGALIEGDGDDVTHAVGLAIVVEVGLETGLVDGAIV